MAGIAYSEKHHDMEKLSGVGITVRIVCFESYSFISRIIHSFGDFLVVRTHMV